MASSISCFISAPLRKFSQEASSAIQIAPPVYYTVIFLKKKSCRSPILSNIYNFMTHNDNCKEKTAYRVQKRTLER